MLFRSHAVTMAADANGAFQPKEAVHCLRRWEPYGLGWIEQPVPARDLDGLRFVREHAATPVMASESITLRDAIPSTS